MSEPAIRTSDTLGKLAVAFVAARVAFPVVTRGRTATIPTNSGSRYTYNYADLSDVLDAVTPVLAEHGLALLQPLGTNGNGAAVVTLLLHTSGEWIESTFPLQSFAKPQEQGSAITYARRYAAVALLGIATEEDDDGAAAQKSTPVTEPEPEPVASIDPTEMLRRDLGKVAKEEGIGAELAASLLHEKFGPDTTSKSLDIDQLRGAAAAFKRYGNQRRKVELLRNQLELTEEGLLATAATILNLEADGVKSLDDLVMHEVDALVVDLELRAALGKDMLEQEEAKT